MQVECWAPKYLMPVVSKYIEKETQRHHHYIGKVMERKGPGLNHYFSSPTPLFIYLSPLALASMALMS
jgi:hypothetical protein